MQTIEIKNRFTRSVIFSVEAAGVKAAVEIAVLRGADLWGAKNAPFVGYGLRWPVLVWGDHMRIGCECHAIDEWREFTDDDIDGMDPEALAFWRVWKEPLLAIAEGKRQAETTDEEAAA